MFILKLFILIFIIQKTVSSPCCPMEHYGDFDEPTETEEFISNEKTTYLGQDLCPEKDQSLISINDIQYYIENIATKIQIEDSLTNQYQYKVKEVHDKYLEKLEELREQFLDRPKHMLHILDDMVRIRQELEPKVQNIEAQMREFEILEAKYYDIAEHSEIQLNQLKKYTKICQINCKDFDIETRFRDTFSNSRFPTGYNMFCTRLKDLNDYITAKLNQFQEEYGQILLNEIEYRNEAYGQNFTDLKINLKNAAVKQFGMTMYDILSLQDDYFHFVDEVRKINISSELHNIEGNSAEIKFKLVGLKRDAEKYRQYCMNCNSERRAKREIFNYQDEWDLHSYDWTEEDFENESHSVDDFIAVKIDEIIEMIKSHFIDMFAELDEDFNDPDLIDSYVTKLQPIQDEIEYDIKREQEALDRLKNSVPNSSINKLLKLSQESKQMILKLESTKQFIDQYI